jgi:Icc-related predicted phosphoesterase
MDILAISDLHGDFRLAKIACDELRPDLVLCCGDWGDAGLLHEETIAEFLAPCPVLTVFGNHDSLQLLSTLRNQDGQPILIGQGEVRVVSNLRVAGISGIWAKSHKLPHYVTDDDVTRWASQIALQGPIDVLLTHACPAGLADLTPTGRHGGQRCFLNAFRMIAPRVHLCGHLHVAQERTLKDGRKVINVGSTPEGSAAVLNIDLATREISSRLTLIRGDASPRITGLDAPG